MFYRVDYVLATIVAGVVLGFLLGRRTAGSTAARLAHAYYLAVVVLLGIRMLCTTLAIVRADAALWNHIAGAASDLTNVLFGVLFGVAARRSDRGDVVREPAVYGVLCLSTGVGFVISGFTKAFYMEGMTQFFSQSGYSLPFLKLIMTLEVLAGVGMLVSWAVLPAVAALGIDMFGAVFTHLHNGDPLDDSTGAITVLLRLAVIAVLWALRPQATALGSARRRLVAIGVATALCLGAAVAGATVVRAMSPTKPNVHASLSLEGSVAGPGGVTRRHRMT